MIFFRSGGPYVIANDLSAITDDPFANAKQKNKDWEFRGRIQGRTNSGDGEFSENSGKNSGDTLLNYWQNYGI